MKSFVALRSMARLFSSALSPLEVSKLKYLATKRGIVENELIFGKFFAPGGGFEQLKENGKEVQLLHNFLQEYDWDIFAWISGQKAVPEEYKHSRMFSLLRESIKLKSKPVESGSETLKHK